MYRSASTSRFSDEFYHPGSIGQLASATMGKGASPAGGGQRSAMEMDYKLPTYDPQSDAGKKDATRTRLSENMVHLIPIILLVCAMILWCFSHPQDVDMGNRDDSIIARIKNMTIDGYSHWNGSSMTMGQDDLDTIEGLEAEDSGRNLDGKDSHQ